MHHLYVKSKCINFAYTNIANCNSGYYVGDGHGGHHVYDILADTEWLCSMFLCNTILHNVKISLTRVLFLVQLTKVLITTGEPCPVSFADNKSK